MNLEAKSSSTLEFMKPPHKFKRSFIFNRPLSLRYFRLLLKNMPLFLAFFLRSSDNSLDPLPPFNVQWTLAVPTFPKTRAEERKGGETSQLALARCVMRGVLGRERSRARTVEKWRVKTKFCSIYKVHCYG